MSYYSIDNLYKAQQILEFKTCYALEKIHGTSAHVSWNEGKVGFFSGGAKHEEFVSLFDAVALAEKFTALGVEKCIVYGEAYGGKMQGMKATYGPKLRFVAFEVKIGESWLAVPDAEKVALSIGLEFIHYNLIPATLEAIDAERDAPSIQAERNGMGDHAREGVVLRPPFEVRTNNGSRIIAKHKRAEFSERKTPPNPLSADKIAVLKEAHAVADEWCTEMRLTHVLDAFPEAGIEKTGDVIRAMMADIEREGAGEMEMSRDAKKIIGAKTAAMFKARLESILRYRTIDCDYVLTAKGQAELDALAEATKKA